MKRLLLLWAGAVLFLSVISVILQWDARAFETSTYSLTNQYEQQVLVTKHVGSLQQIVKTCMRLLVQNQVAAGYTPFQAVSEVLRTTSGEGCATFDDNLTRCRIFVTAGFQRVTAHEERHCTEGAFH